MPPKAKATPTAATAAGSRSRRAAVRYNVDYFEGPPSRPSRARRQRADAPEASNRALPANNTARKASIKAHKTCAPRPKGPVKRATQQSRKARVPASKAPANKAAKQSQTQRAVAKKTAGKGGKKTREARASFSPAHTPPRNSAVAPATRTCISCGQHGHVKTNPICPNHPSHQG